MTKINKIAHGYVIQEFDAETLSFIGQRFIAGDEVDFEDDAGEPVDGSGLPYIPFDMVSKFD